MKIGLCTVALLFLGTLALAEDLKTVTVSHQGTPLMAIRVAQCQGHNGQRKDGH